MNVLFMGTPDFAEVSLKRILSDGHKVCAVFTREDKPKGRGMKLTPPPVKVLAEENGIPVYQPKNFGNQAEITEILDKYKPEIIVVVAYGRLLPAFVLNYPRLGCVNVHGSLLPKLRGACPIQRAVINGDKVTGVTTMYMSEGLDAGDIILKRETEIAPAETSGELFARLSVLGAGLLSETLALIEKGTAPRIPQDETDATFAPIVKKEDARIEWNRKSGEIVDLIRGTNPSPTAYFFIEDIMVKVHEAQASGKSGNFAPGEVIGNGRCLEIACAGGETVFLSTIQVQGGRRMSSEEYLRGHKIPAGTFIR
ncbi:MAG: methionyl-tRNA formyltransferase [Bacillota bacterium]|nr:methionyl-tRNA formyltransferase [Bacillota bacterium]